MEIVIENPANKPALSIIKLNGDLDGSNYQDVILAAKQAHRDGAKYLLVDMENVPFMGSAGLVALHSMALLMQGKDLPNPDDGWSALHTMGSDAQEGTQPYVKILNPQTSVDRGLQKTGMKQYFEVFTDRDEAISSF